VARREDGRAIAWDINPRWGPGPRPHVVIHRSAQKRLCRKSFKNKRYFELGQAKSKVIHMRTPWTLSATESAIFVGMVLALAGAGTWVSVVG